MKNKVFLFIGLFLFFYSETSFCRSSERTIKGTKDVAEHSFRVFSTPDLYQYTATWAGEYCKLHPEMNIEVVRVDDFSQSTVLTSGTDLSFISDKYFAGLDDKAIWKMVIGHEAVVPFVSSKNPFMDRLYSNGVSSGEFSKTISHPVEQTWGMLLGNKQTDPVRFYLVNDRSIFSNVARYLKTSEAVLDGAGRGTRDEIISSVQKDPFGIGFCYLNDLLGPANQKIVENIKLLPIDKNSNGQMDYFEKIYGDLNAFTRGVWIGKYPKDLCRAIYSVSSVKPSNKSELAFLTWVITDGQRFLYPVGYKNFAYSARQAEKAALLTGSQPLLAKSSTSGIFTGKLNSVSLFALVLLALIPFVIVFMIADALKRDKRQKQAEMLNLNAVPPAVFDVSSVKVPQGLYFNKTHMWAFMEKNGLVRVGIDDFLQHTTGPLTGIKMKNPGERVKMGDQVLSIIQCGKQLRINAPVSGMIMAQNTDLLTNSSALNSSPYSDGWIYIIEPANWLRETRFLTMAGQYREWLKKEFVRLKDFIAETLKSNNPEFAHVILQDGGELRDGVLSELGPKEWEDFQVNFIDRSR
ncbi:MAG: hypothetical protein Q8M08_03435 [Bacteroidales bacterium]|nr:hypothetical protein [Bacteroidales bacterium]